MQHWRGGTKKTHGVIEMSAAELASQMSTDSLVDLADRPTLEQRHVASSQRAVSHWKATRLSLGITEQPLGVKARLHDVFVQSAVVIDGPMQ